MTVTRKRKQPKKPSPKLCPKCGATLSAEWLPESPRRAHQCGSIPMPATSTVAIVEERAPDDEMEAQQSAPQPPTSTDAPAEVAPLQTEDAMKENELISAVRCEHCKNWPTSAIEYIKGPDGKLTGDRRAIVWCLTEGCPARGSTEEPARVSRAVWNYVMEAIRAGTAYDRAQDPPISPGAQRLDNMEQSIAHLLGWAGSLNTDVNRRISEHSESVDEVLAAQGKLQGDLARVERILVEHLASLQQGHNHLVASVVHVAHVVNQLSHRLFIVEQKLGFRPYLPPTTIVVTKQGEIAMTPIQGSLAPLSPGFSVTLQINPFDENGNPTVVPEGVEPAWAVSDTTNFQLDPAEDGLTCAVTCPEDATIGVGTSGSVALPDGTASGSFSLSIVAGPTGAPVVLIVTEVAPPAPSVAQAPAAPTS